MASSAAVFLRSALLLLVLSAVGAEVAGHPAESTALRGGRMLKTADTQTCANGLAGYQGINGACCPLRCGQCGGDHCNDAAGGAKECCANGVINNQPKCSESNKAPCYIPELSGTCANGIPGIEHGNLNGDVCCDLACGVCGDSGCNKAPGGARKCCINTILYTAKDCAVSGEAPCYISEDHAAPVVIPVTVPTPVGEDEMCSNGVVGIDGANRDGQTVCCPLACGEFCGGDGCANAGPGLTNEDCCPNGIIKNQPDCAGTPTAPCYISKEATTPAPVDDSTPAPVEGGKCINGFPGIDGKDMNGVDVCCPLECHQCGGQGCSTSGSASRLDNTDCCPNGIVRTQHDCSPHVAAPCVITTAGTPAPVDDPTPAPVDDPTPAPVDDPTPAPVDNATPAPFTPATPAPSTPAPMEVTGPTCPGAGGIPGIQNNKVGSGTVCCDPGCATCGGGRCHEDPLGRRSCCIGPILKNKGYCGNGTVAPCKISVEA